MAVVWQLCGSCAAVVLRVCAAASHRFCLVGVGLVSNQLVLTTLHLIVRAKRTTTAGRAGQQAQNGAKPQSLMASAACRWRSASARG